MPLAGWSNYPSGGILSAKGTPAEDFIDFLDPVTQARLQRMFAQPTAQLRKELLGLNGVGPETADSILLYAGGHPVFVVDAYTRRILLRHGLAEEGADYEELRSLCEEALGRPAFASECEAAARKANGGRSGPEGSCHSPSRMSRQRRSATAQVLNEMHGLLVGVAKNYCLKSQVRCERCPLRETLRGKPAGLSFAGAVRPKANSSRRKRARE